MAGKTLAPFPLTERLDPWEARWAPYDEATYQAVLAYLRPTDVVLDIGAGDLRLARQIASRVCRVYAIERQPHVVAQGIRTQPLPPNLHVFVGDARRLPFPPGVTVAVLLMRHCRHFRLYVRKLQAVGCRYLITNARWGLDVEKVDLLAPRRAYEAIRIGWYACLCGATGFVEGPPEAVTPGVLARVHEVDGCPRCRKARTSPDGARAWSVW